MTLPVLLRSTSPFTAAVELLRDDSRFSTSREAAESFIAAGQGLGRAGQECVRAESREARRCSALLAAAGYTEIAALRVVDCTRPGVFDARRATIDHLHDLRDHVASEGDPEPPDPPPLPRC